eukprot:scaffold5916_cov44-Cyclotella_meneghiniana.AAC.3
MILVSGAIPCQGVVAISMPNANHGDGKWKFFTCLIIMTSYTSCHIIAMALRQRETPTGAFSAVRMACKESASSRQNGWRGCYEEDDVTGE